MPLTPDLQVGRPLSCYFLLQALAVLAVTLLATPALGARTLQQAVTDADVYNFALNLEYLEVSLNPV